jgi:hypothetical protein
MWYNIFLVSWILAWGLYGFRIQARREKANADVASGLSVVWAIVILVVPLVIGGVLDALFRRYISSGAINSVDYYNTQAGERVLLFEGHEGFGRFASSDRRVDFLDASTGKRISYSILDDPNTVYLGRTGAVAWAHSIQSVDLLAWDTATGKPLLEKKSFEKKYDLAKEGLLARSCGIDKDQLYVVCQTKQGHHFTIDENFKLTSLDKGIERSVVRARVFPEYHLVEAVKAHNFLNASLLIYNTNGYLIRHDSELGGKKDENLLISFVDRDGKLRWTFPRKYFSEGRLFGALQFEKGFLIFFNETNSSDVLAIDAVDGHVIWKY